MTKGEHTIKIEEFSAEYNNYSSGVESVSVDNKAAVNVYPNPVVADVLTVTSSADIAGVEIYSLSGAKATEKQGGSSTVTVDVSALQPGVYFAVIETAQDKVLRKIIVK